MKKIVIINGSGTSGKDEVVKISISNLERKNIKVKSISSVEKVKEIAKQLGWFGDKNDLSRRFLSDIKDAWTRYNNGPLMDIAKKIDELNSDEDWLVFVHIREPEEIHKMKHFIGIKDEHGEIVTLLIRRPNIEKFDNHADSNVYEYSYDYIIENDEFISKLVKSVQTFLEDIELL